MGLIKGIIGFLVGFFVVPIFITLPVILIVVYYPPLFKMTYIIVFILRIITLLVLFSIEKFTGFGFLTSTILEYLTGFTIGDMVVEYIRSF